MYKNILVVFSVLGLCLSRPTSESFDQIIQEGLEDIEKLIEAKGASLQYAGDSITKGITDAASSTGETVSEFDPIEFTNELEEAVIETKVGHIRAVFEAKRTLLKGMQQIIKEHQQQLINILNSTTESLNQAVNTTSQGFSVTKSVVADFTANVTLENTMNTITEALANSNQVIQQTLDNFLESLVNFKENLHESTENFNSKEVIRGTTSQIGSALNVTAENAEILADNLGIFDALDSVVSGIFQLPYKFNTIFISQDEEEEQQEEEEQNEETTEATEDEEEIVETTEDVQSEETDSSLSGSGSLDVDIDFEFNAEGTKQDVLEENETFDDTAVVFEEDYKNNKAELEEGSLYDVEDDTPLF